MKIAICVNHSYPHCGGSEKVVQSISEGLVHEYGYDCLVISKSLKSPLKYNGVYMTPCPSSFDAFLSKLSSFSPDIVLVYSDCFVYWRDIVRNHNKISGLKFLVPVGMNQALSHSSLMALFKKNKKHFNIITHSDNYIDYNICKNIGLSVSVIPNGVDLKEFDDTDFDFKQEYNINKKIILCVSNFFPGKGQEHLIKILEGLKQKRQDWEAVFMSATVNFSYAKILSSKTQQQLNVKKIPHKFLIDVPRKHVISAMLASDVFAFPTQKEVSPIVVLESMAARLPWVAMTVGNISQLKGGKIIKGSGKDKDGYMKFSNNTYKLFEDNIGHLLDDTEEKRKLKEEGRALIENKYNWDLIIKQYDSVFRREYEKISC